MPFGSVIVVTDHRHRRPSCVVLPSGSVKLVSRPAASYVMVVVAAAALIVVVAQVQGVVERGRCVPERIGDRFLVA